MNPSPAMQLGFDHATDAYPYLYRMDRDKLYPEELRDYARGYIFSRPDGYAGEAKFYPGNIKSAKRDAQHDVSTLGFFRMLLSLFNPMQ